jgi:putative tricarboxylic transport membrane protein
MGIVDGFTALFSSWEAVAFALAGTMIGLLGGAVPGLSSGAMIALLIPITYYLDPLAALALIYTVSKASDFGGSIPAILFNTPGTPQASATQIEGFPLTQQGKQGKALRMAVIASAQGDLFSELLLIFGAATLAVFASRLGPPEFVAIYLCAFAVIGGLLGKSLLTGLLSVVLGLALSLVGTDPITADDRFTFGIDGLLDGIELVPVLLGMFVLAEVFERGATRTGLTAERAIAGVPRAPSDNYVTFREYKRVLPTLIRSTGIGAAIGMLPGLGSVVACFVAYSEAKRRSKTPETWGKGEIEGIAAAEASNNATSGANLIPLLTLGIPGSTAAALLSGVMLIHGIEIGPNVFTTSHDVIYGVFAAGLLCIATYFVVGYWGSRYVGALIAKIPVQMVYPIIFVTCYVAVFATRQALIDMVVMTIFGLLGFAMKRLDMSVPAFVIAFILGPGLERAMRQSFLLDESGAGIFLERPVALASFLLGALSLAFRLCGGSLHYRKQGHSRR